MHTPNAPASASTADSRQVNLDDEDEDLLGDAAAVSPVAAEAPLTLQEAPAAASEAASPGVRPLEAVRSESKDASVVRSVLEGVFTLR